MQDRKERYSFNKLGRKRNVVCKEIIDRENCQNGKKKNSHGTNNISQGDNFHFQDPFSGTNNFLNKLLQLNIFSILYTQNLDTITT